MASSSELGCVYAALILHDDGVDVTAENISALLMAANVEFEPIWPSLFAKAISGNIGDLLSNVGAPSAGVAVAAAPGAGGNVAGAGAAEEKAPEPEEEEEEEDMDFDLFD